MIQYNSQYVDEKYLPILEPNLYADTVLIPGVTYTDKYQTGPAGQVFVHKVHKGDEVTPKTPGQDFDHEETSDDLIPIAINNNFQKSKKIYGVQMNAVTFPIAEENLSIAVQSSREGRQYSGLACLANEGRADADTTPITTGDAAMSTLIRLRKAIRDAHGKANFALVNTNAYSLLLEKLGLKSYADPAIVTAELVQRFGLVIIECNAFDKSDAKYYNASSKLTTVDLTDVEMIVGYYEAFSIIDNLEAMRLKESENFVGTLAQVEINTGMTVTNSDMIVVKKATPSE